MEEIRLWANRFVLTLFLILIGLMTGLQLAVIMDTEDMKNVEGMAMFFGSMIWIRATIYICLDHSIRTSSQFRLVGALSIVATMVSVIGLFYDPLIRTSHLVNAFGWVLLSAVAIHILKLKWGHKPKAV